MISRAGFQVVESNSDATFLGILRAKDVNKNVTLDNNQSPKPSQELLLKKGATTLWAATADVKLNSESHWQAYVIPPIIRANPSRMLPVFGKMDICKTTLRKWIILEPLLSKSPIAMETDCQVETELSQDANVPKTISWNWLRPSMLAS